MEEDNNSGSGGGLLTASERLANDDNLNQLTKKLQEVDKNVNKIMEQDKLDKTKYVDNNIGNSPDITPELQKVNDNIIKNIYKANQLLISTKNALDFNFKDFHEFRKAENLNLEKMLDNITKNTDMKVQQSSLLDLLNTIKSDIVKARDDKKTERISKNADAEIASYYRAAEKVFNREIDLSSSRDFGYEDFHDFRLAQNETLVDKFTEFQKQSIDEQKDSLVKFIDEVNDRITFIRDEARTEKNKAAIAKESAADQKDLDKIVENIYRSFSQVMSSKTFKDAYEAGYDDFNKYRAAKESDLVNTVSSSVSLGSKDEKEQYLGIILGDLKDELVKTRDDKKTNKIDEFILKEMQKEQDKIDKAKKEAEKESANYQKAVQTSLDKIERIFNLIVTNTDVSKYGFDDVGKYRAQASQDLMNVVNSALSAQNPLAALNSIEEALSTDLTEARDTKRTDALNKNTTEINYLISSIKQFGNQITGSKRAKDYGFDNAVELKIADRNALEDRIATTVANSDRQSVKGNLEQLVKDMEQEWISVQRITDKNIMAERQSKDIDTLANDIMKANDKQYRNAKKPMFSGFESMFASDSELIEKELNRKHTQERIVQDEVTRIREQNKPLNEIIEELEKLNAAILGQIDIDKERLDIEKGIKKQRKDTILSRAFSNKGGRGGSKLNTKRMGAMGTIAGAGLAGLLFGFDPITVLSGGVIAHLFGNMIISGIGNVIKETFKSLVKKITMPGFLKFTKFAAIGTGLFTGINQAIGEKGGFMEKVTKSVIYSAADIFDNLAFGLADSERYKEEIKKIMDDKSKGFWEKTWGVIKETAFGVTDLLGTIESYTEKAGSWLARKTYQIANLFGGITDDRYREYKLELAKFDKEQAKRGLSGYTYKEYDEARKPKLKTKPKKYDEEDAKYGLSAYTYKEYDKARNPKPKQDEDIKKSKVETSKSMDDDRSMIASYLQRYSTSVTTNSQTQQTVVSNNSKVVHNTINGLDPAMGSNLRQINSGFVY